MTNIKSILFLALVSISLGAALLASATYLYNFAVRVGIDKYHEQCYTIGGMIIDAQGRVVQCGPVAQIPKKELDNFNKL